MYQMVLSYCVQETDVYKRILLKRNSVTEERRSGQTEIRTEKICW